MTRRMRRRAGLLAVLGGLVLGLGLTTTAVANHVGCGQTINASTKLDSDIGPCAAGGIIIGADNITFNLNGHTIRGTSSPGDGVGILLTTRTGVVVKNGTVRDFDVGVVLESGATNNAATRLTVRDNIGTGETDFGDGIVISSSSNNQVLRSRAVHNGPFDGIGVFGASSTGNLIKGNVVTDNNVLTPTEHDHEASASKAAAGGRARLAEATSASDGPSTAANGDDGFQQDDGIRLEPGTHANTVEDNQVSRNGLDGIAVFFRAPDNVVRDNTVDSNGREGIRLFLQANQTLVEKNDVFKNGNAGIRVDSQMNQILSNDTAKNAFLGVSER